MARPGQVILATGYAALTAFAAVQVHLARVSWAGLAGLILAGAVAVAILWNPSAIASIRGNFGKTQLDVRMKQVEEAVYAKLETVRELGEQVAATAAFSACHVGRFAPDDLTERLGDVRARLNRLLEALGVGPARRTEILLGLDQTIVRDLQGKIREVAHEKFKVKFGDNREALQAAAAELKAILGKQHLPGSGAELETWLRMQTVMDPRLEALVRLWQKSTPCDPPE